jgi:hypothetical protein
MEAEAREHAEYERPTVTDYGDIFEITAAAQAGSHLDAAFPINTPSNQLTFS